MGQIVTVNFRGDELYGFESDDGVFIAMKPIVDGMGIAWNAQYERLHRDPILSKGIRVMRTPFTRGGAQDVICLKLELVNGWLFTVDASRIKDPEAQRRVILYQEECYQVLNDHFTGKRRRVADPLEGEPIDEEPINVRRLLVSEARQTFGIQAARELWLDQKLPVTPSMLQPDAQPSLFTYVAKKDEDAA